MRLRILVTNGAIIRVNGWSDPGAVIAERTIDIEPGQTFQICSITYHGIPEHPLDFTVEASE